MSGEDWTPQKIVSELTKKGIHLNQLMDENQIDMSHPNAFSLIEHSIAKALDIPLQTIWPSRYAYD